MTNAKRYREYFPVRQLEDQPRVEFYRQLAIEQCDLETEDIDLAEAVIFHLRFTGTPDRVQVRGRIRTSVRLQCDRCLEPFTRPIRARFATLFLPMSEMPTHSHRITQSEDLITAYFTAERIELWEMIREQILLRIPLKRLCRKDCRGLCVHCGVNRNVQTCHCATNEVDPRWAPLQKWLRSLS